MCLPRVRRDGSLWHSCPDCTVEWPGTTPEMSASKGRSRGGSSCCCRWVGKPWYCKRSRSFSNTFLKSLSPTFLRTNSCCHTCIKLRTVHRSNHRTQFPSSCKKKQHQNQRIYTRFHSLLELVGSFHSKQMTYKSLLTSLHITCRVEKFSSKLWNTFFNFNFLITQ